MKKAIVLLITCLFSGTMFANHWVSEHPGNYQFVMALNGVIQIDGVEQTSDQFEVGAFCNGECRGSQMASVFPYTGRYIIMLSIDGDPGDQITFKLFDHSEGEELDLVSPDAITFDNDGLGTYFDPYVLNFLSSGTSAFNLPITGYGSSAGGYNLIASPIDNLAPATVPGMTEGNYDLYYFDQSQEGEEWQNYKVENFNLTSGNGYLYAHNTDVILSFTGIPYNGTGQVTLSKTEGVEFEGWNLVGNPYSQPAYILGRDFYVMNGDGSDLIVAETAEVDPMQGVFVIANENGEVLTFSRENNSGQGSKLVISASQERGGVIDRAIVRFEDNHRLPKFALNPYNTKLYFQQEGADYAVVGRSADNLIPVSFMPDQESKYTLSFDMVDVELDYLHLLDGVTGADVDLLALQQTQGVASYMFVARTTDPVDRFSLDFGTFSSVQENRKPFAFYHEGEICLAENCEGACLQIIDVNGRVVADMEFTHTVSTHGLVPGVYVLRLINDVDVKMQKIVVR